MERVEYYIDLETTVNGGPNFDEPDAHWYANFVLLCGWIRRTDTTEDGVHTAEDCDALVNAIDLDIKQGNEVVIFAHNAKFDIKYLMRDYPKVEWHKVHVQCTQTWWYLLTGHLHKFISLEELAAELRVPFQKTLDLGALLAQGIKMEDIPSVDLLTYLELDVAGLYGVVKELKSRNSYWMDYILPLCEMELNGLHIDRMKLAQHLTADEATLRQHIQHIENMVQRHLEWGKGDPVVIDNFDPNAKPKVRHIKVTSNRVISYLLTGYPKKGVNTGGKHTLVFRNGYGPLLSKGDIVAMHQKFKDTNLGIPVNDGALDFILQSTPSPHVTDFINKVKAIRSLEKLIGTYWQPWLNISQLQDAVYPTLHTTSTGTGRLSSANPNGQNIPPVARELVTPVNDEYEMLEIDFSQLEIYSVAIISQCQDLLNALRSGVDVHYQSGKDVFGWTHPSQMTKEDRKIVKGVNFGLLYGGTASGLAASTGVDKHIVAALIKSFYKQFPGVKRWKDDTFTGVVSNLDPYDIKEGEQRYASRYDCPVSDRHWCFVETASPPWLQQKSGRKWSLSPQQVANYPIQGFAGADVVMRFLWCLWYLASEERNKGLLDILFIMTVHDSVLMEIRKHDIRRLDMLVRVSLNYVKQTFNLPIDLQTEQTWGPNWS